MIHAHDTISTSGGIFQFHGPCQGEPCPAGGNNRYLADACTQPPNSIPDHPFGFPSSEVFFARSMTNPRPRPLLLPDRLQIQNA
jgi:hypothetical protein